MIVIMTPTRRPLRVLRGAVALAAGAAVVATVSGCQSAASSPDGAVVTSFYPLQFATEQIVGRTLPVTVLTKPGAEPHDLELTPQDLAGMTKARLVVYSDGFQPAVDDAMVQVDPANVLDVADAAELTLVGGDDDSGGAEDEHAEGSDEDGHAGADPHFWLDPQRYAAVVRAIGTRLEAVDPAHAA